MVKGVNMIEIIKNEENAAAHQKSIIVLPKNVRQIGECRQDKRIYIEDYVVGYLKSLKQAAVEQRPQVGVFMGRIMHDEQGSYNFIRGAVLCGENPMEGEAYFSQRIWVDTYKSIDKYFPNMEIVGWFGIFEDISTDEKKGLDKVFVDNFAGRMKTLFLVNIAAEEENFYFIEEEQVKKQPGYMQFFEKNTEMQEYIVAMRGQVSCEERQPESVVMSFRSLVQEKQEERSKKKAWSLAYGIGSFMVVLLLVMGISLMNNYDKINQFDQILQDIKNQFVHGKEDDNKTNVVDVMGNVHPTESSSEAATKENPTRESESEGSSEGSSEDPSKGQQPQTQAQTQPQTQPQTQAQTQPQTQAQTQPQTQATPTGGTAVRTHTIVSGETLRQICIKYYGTGTPKKIEEVAKYNGLENADKIYAGQTIKLP